MPRLTALCVVLVAGLGTARAGEDGFKPLFNGKDLTGWVNVNCAPDTFFVKDDMIITTGKPTGYLRTDKQYENFIAEFDWFHAPPKKGVVGNSGFFVWADPIPAMGTGYTRGIEVQVLVNLTWTDKKSGKETATSQGDLFSIWGAKCKPDRPHPLGWERCLPSENRQKGEFEWNHFRIEANNGVIKLAVNGKVVSGVSECNPRKGYLGLESEGSECRFKNLKIKVLPSTNPKPEECADVDKGFKSMFTGADFSGWTGTKEPKEHWKTEDGVLIFDGKPGKQSRLSTEKTFGDFELVFDWMPSGSTKYTNLRYRGNGEETGVVSGLMTLGPGGEVSVCSPPTATIAAKKVEIKAGKWNRVNVHFKEQRASVRINGKIAIDNFDLPALKGAPGAISFDGEGAMRIRNIFIRELKKDE